MTAMSYDWITFLTDYGLANKFTGVCRGVIARIAREARVLEITHLVPRGDVRHGAVVLEQAVPYLPRAVHLAVVDPGVGTDRRAIAVMAGGSVFVGPDNGLLMWAADELGGVEAAYKLSEPSFMLQPMSNTFHGRDLFSPFAAHIANGVDLDQLGPALPVESLVRLARPILCVEGDQVEGEVVLVDLFGNLQTSVDEAALRAISTNRSGALEIRLGDAIHHISYEKTFGSVAEGALLAHIDSAGLLALAVNRGDAAKTLGMSVGSTFTLRRLG